MIKSCLAVLLNYDHPQVGQAKALRYLHATYGELDYLRLGAVHADKGLVDWVTKLSPDWVWLQLQDTGVITAQAIEMARAASPRTVFAHWTGDARAQVSPYFASICRAADVTFGSAKGLLPAFLAAGARRAEYLQIGLDWDEDVLGVPAWEPPFAVPPVVFCGGYYAGTFPGTTDRVELVKTLAAAGIPVGIVGAGWPGGMPVVGKCGVKQQHHVYRRAKVALSCNHFSNLEQYYSDRQLIAMASGTPVVCQYVPGLEREFVNGKHCFWYRSTDEAVQIVKQLLGDPGLARCVGRQGRAEVMTNHNWIRRMTEAMTIVEAIQMERL